MSQQILDSFNNTEIAFAAKSDWNLKKALWLFSIVNNPGISKVATTMAQLFPVKPIIKATIFEHFCGGETIEESTPTVDTLARYGVQTILDYSVEGGVNEANFDESAAEIKHTIENASHQDHIPFAVFKVSGLANTAVFEKVQKKEALSEAESISYQNAEERIEMLCKTAHDLNVPILIDAEDSWYQDVIDEIVYRMMSRFNQERGIVFNTFQMYRKDMLSNLASAIEDARNGGYHFGAKLVRGAYMEKERERAAEMGYPDPICSTKAYTDKSFDDGLSLCMENIEFVSLANCTHNEQSCAHLADLIEAKGLQKNDPRIFFAQLMGMSDNISFNLAAAGYNVAKYVPYGPVKRVMPYLIRRADENTSVAGQSSRELNLIQSEIRRRRNHK